MRALRLVNISSSIVFKRHSSVLKILKIWKDINVFVEKLEAGSWVGTVDLPVALWALYPLDRGDPFYTWVFEQIAMYLRDSILLKRAPTRTCNWPQFQEK